jgi:hypothetical protein
VILKETIEFYGIAGSKSSNKIAFGGDFFMEYDLTLENKINKWDLIHRNIIPYDFSELKDKLSLIDNLYHNHKGSTGDFITATDLCTMLLYKDFIPTNKFAVKSKHYYSEFNNETLDLNIYTNKFLSKVNKDE